MRCSTLSLLVALAVVVIIYCSRAKCSRCRILCGCSTGNDSTKSVNSTKSIDSTVDKSADEAISESMLPNRLPPAYGPFDAPSAQTLQREIKQNSKKLGERLFERGWVFITADCQNCDPEDATAQGPNSAVLGVEGAHVVNAENEPNFALFAGVQEPPGWFNMKTGQYIPNVLPRDALEILASK